MKLQVIVGGQAGSEGKGAVAGHLAAQLDAPTCIRVAGPNAGHTVVNPKTGTRLALRQIPVGVVTNPAAIGCIAAGSEVDLDVLAAELEMLRQDEIYLHGRLFIDPSATVLLPSHIEQEKQLDLTGRVGSTGKGIGAARADRIMRSAPTIRDMYDARQDVFGPALVANVGPYAVGRGQPIQIEGTQGYQLGLHHRFYPQVTSSDCTALDFLAMARINPWNVRPSDLEVWVVFRPYPIRVAGNSGPMHEERTWQDLNLPEEKTTVTQKVRRVGLFDPYEAADAVAANSVMFPVEGGINPLRLALTMADQLDPELAGVTDYDAVRQSKLFREFLEEFRRACGRTPHMITTSDRTYAMADRVRRGD
jgi:adenylosuccinate synthase